MSTERDDTHLPITRCPHCKTAFRIRESQLTQRRGMVRCGACRGVFNAIQHMLHQRGDTITIVGAHDEGVPPGYVQAPAQLNPLTLMPEEIRAAAIPPLSAPSPTAEANTPSPTAHLARPSSTSAMSEAGIAANPPSFEAQSGSILAASTSAPSPSPTPSPTPKGQPVEFEISTDELEATLAGQPKPLDALERFERQERNYEWRPQEAPRAPWAGVFWGMLAALMAAVLIGQIIFVFRNEIVGRLPQMRPLLAQACTTVGCQLAAPQRPSELVIDGAEFTRDESHSGLYSLSATLRNRSAYPSAYPSLVVTLTGLNNTVLSRRVFAPTEFLSGQVDLKNGLHGNGEIEFKLFLDASTIQPVGFDVRTTYGASVR